MSEGMGNAMMRRFSGSGRCKGEIFQGEVDNLILVGWGWSDGAMEGSPEVVVTFQAAGSMRERWFQDRLI